MSAAFGGGPIFSYSFVAGEDLSAAQYRFVKLSADNTVVRCTGATDLPIGVLQNKPSAAGQAANVVVAGITRVVGSAALTYGNIVGTDADGGSADGGRAVAKTTDKDIGPGIVIQGTSAEDEIAVIFVNCMSKNAMSL